MLNKTFKLREFLHTQYPDMETYEKISDYFNEMAIVIEEVFFEIGLITGAKIGYQLREKIDELK